MSTFRRSLSSLSRLSRVSEQPHDLGLMRSFTASTDGKAADAEDQAPTRHRVRYEDIVSDHERRQLPPEAVHQESVTITTGNGDDVFNYGSSRP